MGGESGVKVDDEVEPGGGETEANRSLMFWFWVPDIGLGAANCVADVVVDVDAGGGMENAPIEAAGFAGAAAGAGAAD